MSRPCALPGCLVAFEPRAEDQLYCSKDCRRVAIRRRPAANGRDLEAIVALLELAALTLTPSLGATFTQEELLREVREIGGDEIEIQDSDIKNVLGKAGFLRKEGGRFSLK